MRETIYLDHAATTPLLPAAREAMEQGFAIWANPSSPHKAGRAARAALEEARERVKTALGWQGEVVFTSGASEAIALANDCEYGLTSSLYTRDLSKAMQAMREIDFGETYINRENFEAMQGFHAGVRKSGVGGADGKHGLYEYTHTHEVYLQS